MSLTNIPASERPHIAFFGMRNAGKSSVVNAITNQNLSIVSDRLGTTTDPVTKSMEILPLGPVVIIDTPGFDDEGELGVLRVEKTKEVLRRTDIAVLIVDGSVGLRSCDLELEALFKEHEIPYIMVYNKADLSENINSNGKTNGPEDASQIKTGANFLTVSAKTKEGIHELKEKIGHFLSQKNTPSFVVRDLIQPEDLVILVIPIDESAPKDRIILPQQMVLRECLDQNAVAICVQPKELPMTLNSLSKKPALVITDSQAFSQVSKDTPKELFLTSFSILMAKYKGFLETAIQGVSKIESLKDGSRILIAEGCTHHRQCNDIGTVKLPNLLRSYTKCDLLFDFCSGRDYPKELSSYDLVIHCGGCMITETEMHSRMKQTVHADIPFTNYGITLAYLNGILPRSIEIFPKLLSLLE